MPSELLRMAFVATAHPNLALKLHRPTLGRSRPSLVHTAVAGVLSFRAMNQRMHNKVMVVDGAALMRPA